jgi:hypothetical protein
LIPSHIQVYETKGEDELVRVFKDLQREIVTLQTGASALSCLSQRNTPSAPPLPVITPFSGKQATVVTSVMSSISERTFPKIEIAIPPVDARSVSGSLAEVYTGDGDELGSSAGTPWKFEQRTGTPQRLTESVLESHRAGSRASDAGSFIPVTPNAEIESVNSGL